MSRTNDGGSLAGKAFRRAGKVRGLPFYIFGFLFFFLFLNLEVMGKDPVISSVEPKVCQPGDVIVIKGKYFGKDRGKISIAGVVPVSSAYLEWTPAKIAVTVPEDASSGLLYVITPRGKSEGILVTNKNDIPVIVRESDNEGRPFIETMDPEQGSVGTLLSLTGRNFGASRGSSLVYFAWAPMQMEEAATGEGRQASQSIPASALDYDYEGWSDREIRIRVPMGAGSGNVMVVTEKGKSNSLYFELDQSVGKRIYKDKKTYTVQSSVDIRNAEGGSGAGLYLWIPRVQENSVQREVQLLSQDPPAEMENYNGLMLVYLEDVAKMKKRRVTQTFILDRYAMETKIDAAKVKNDFSAERPLYKVYTASNSFTPADNSGLGEKVKAVVGNEKNPYLKAKKLYKYVLDRMNFDSSKNFQEAVKGHEEGAGDAYTYATLYVAMLRNSGIPSRTIAGYIVNEDKEALPHFWSEFYLEGFGWVPADPALGDSAKLPRFLGAENPEEANFGSLDNRHIAFSVGLVQARRISPHGRTLEQPEIHSLQTLYAEAVGDLKSYEAAWNNLQVVGVY